MSADTIYRMDEDEQQADTRPGNYYVSVVDGPQFALIAGPFPLHAEALAMVRPARHLARELDIKSVFYAFGTCRTPDAYEKPGLLNERLGLEIQWWNGKTAAVVKKERERR